MSGRDIYGEADGPKQNVESREAALATVRTVHPSARLEGSTGDQVTFWVGQECVGSAWQRRNARWFVRVRHG
jgi:hypothetical protein